MSHIRNLNKLFLLKKKNWKRILLWYRRTLIVFLSYSYVYVSSDNGNRDDPLIGALLLVRSSCLDLFPLMMPILIINRIKLKWASLIIILHLYSLFCRILFINGKKRKKKVELERERRMVMFLLSRLEPCFTEISTCHLSLPRPDPKRTSFWDGDSWPIKTPVDLLVGKNYIREGMHAEKQIIYKESRNLERHQETSGAQ